MLVTQPVWMIPLTKQHTAYQVEMKTCSSLTDAQCAQSKRETFRHNFLTLSEARLSQALTESLLRIDNCTNSMLLTLPPNIKSMRVSEFVARYSTGQSFDDYIFEAPKPRHAHQDDRASGEDLRRKVRQQLADTKTSLSMSIPGTGPFLQMPESSRREIVNVLNAVVVAYNQAQKDNLS